MILSAVSFLVVAQSISEVPEGLMNNPVYCLKLLIIILIVFRECSLSFRAKSFVF